MVKAIGLFCLNNVMKCAVLYNKVLSLLHKAKIDCASDEKMNEFILFFSWLVLSLTRLLNICLWIKRLRFGALEY